MRRPFRTLVLIFSFALVLSASAASGKVVKVLPHLLDAQGQHTISPSLYDRDAYQAKLRLHPELCSGIRYDVQWRIRTTTAQVKLRVELRGIAKGNLPQQKTIEQTVAPGRGSTRWTGLTLAGNDYKSFGEVTAWRVTLWDGDQLLGEEKSFLW